MEKYILLALIVGGAIAFLWVNVRKDKTPKLVQDQQADKEANLHKILTYFQNSPDRKVANNDIENLLGVSDATVTRYLEELEQKGKIRQVGATGRYVHYELVK